MLRYFIQRLIGSVAVLLGMIFLVMLILELIPGDPAALMLGEFATEETIQQVRHELGLDKPILIRYVNYIWELLHGNLGRSIREMSPVRDLIAETWPKTLQLTSAAMFLTLLIGLPIGIISGAKPGSWIDHTSRVQGRL